MGNCLFSCIYPKLDENDEQIEVCRRNSSFINIEDVFAQEQANKSFEKSNYSIYTIENDMFSPSRISLNDHRISSDLFETNLNEMSRDLEISIDSGFSTPTLSHSMDASVDVLSIKIDSLSRRNSLYSKSISYCSRFISSSIANMPFILRNSIGHLAVSKKAFINKSLFSPVFIAEMKEKSFGAEQKALKSSDECEKQQVSSQDESVKKTSQATSFTTTSFRNFLLRIYDVNFF